MTLDLITVKPVLTVEEFESATELAYQSNKRLHEQNRHDLRYAKLSEARDLTDYMKGEGVIWLATSNKSPLGYSMGTTKIDKKSDFMIDWVFAADAAKHKGVGTNLVQTMERHAKEKGYENIVSYITKDNLISQSMMKKCGFSLSFGLDKFYLKDEFYAKKSLK